MINFLTEKNSFQLLNKKTYVHFINEDKIQEEIKAINTMLNIELPILLIDSLLEKKCSYIQHFFNDYSLFIKKISFSEKLNADSFRRASAEVINDINIPNNYGIFLNIPIIKNDLIEKIFTNKNYYVQSFLEGFVLGNYRFQKYKSDKYEGNFSIFINYSDLPDSEIEKIVTNTQKLMANVLLTRDLENLPSSDLTPEIFTNLISENIRDKKISIKVLDNELLVSNKLNGLLAVGKGSENKPKFVILEYNGNTESKEKIVLIGKGITFDSGGISIKSSSDMWEMKADMSGAAVVFGAILTCFDLSIKQNIVCLLPLAENMPSGSAQKPGDIITTSSGKTIEVDNTDAEGRLLLADALEYAQNFNPKYVIDFATLTLAIVVAFGPFAAGLFSNDENLENKIKSSSKKTFERLWSLPIWDDYNSKIKSSVADVKNVGGKWGGAITAACFLNKFVDNHFSWAHIDIAGTSFPEDSIPYMKDTMTGFGVRLIIDFLENL